MTRTPRRSLGALAAAAATLAAAAVPLAAGPALGAHDAAAGHDVEAVCQPTEENRPVCAADAPAETATFLDPTARVTNPHEVALGHQVYVGPFAVLAASPLGPISIAAEANVQDNVRVTGRTLHNRSERLAIAELGLESGSGVEIGERVILAHGSEVRGPAQLGVATDVAGGVEGDRAPDAVGSEASAGASVDTVAAAEPTESEPAEGAAEAADSGVFLSFGALVDGAVLERDTALSALSRVGPGVRLRSGTVVLPGKNVTTQAEADDRSLGKVRDLVETDVAFNAGVVEVNVGLAREYTNLYRDDASAVRGINLDPGGNEFDESRDAPTVESDLCTGPEVRDPDFRNRVIGDVCFEDSREDLDRVMGRSISLRADEGGPFGIGAIDAMEDRVTFHALEGSDLAIGDRVSYGTRAIVHGGGRPQVDLTTGLAEPTTIGNDVRLGARSVVFRSLLRNGTRVGTKSAVVGSQTAVDQVIPDRTIYANDAVFGPVEW